MCKTCKYWKEKLITKKDGIIYVYGYCSFKQQVILRIDESGLCPDYEEKS